MARISAPRGTRDILPAEVEIWQRLEEVVRRTCAAYGYSEIRTPIFEHTELFERGIGEVTDIVEKEMYTFLDRGDRSITLRPEGTAPVVRAYLENKLYGEALPVKLFYIGPMFRYERPQAGRYRQFHQFGAEAIGSPDPALDAEMILLSEAIYGEFGLEDCRVKINSIGCPECRSQYRVELKKYLEPKLPELCESCRDRYERSPMRVLDCKREGCIEATKEAPSMESFLCGECAGHFESVKRYLSRCGLSYEVNHRLVRGFDYYTKTVFEVTSPSLGAQDAVGGGGRYDGLVEECGGKPTPGVGFAAGMERMILALQKSGGAVSSRRVVDVFIASPDGTDRAESVRLANLLRNSGLTTEMDYVGRGLRAQMRAAGKANARIVLILGEDELSRGEVSLRDMKTAHQVEIKLEELVQEIKARLDGGDSVEVVEPL